MKEVLHTNPSTSPSTNSSFASSKSSTSSESVRQMNSPTRNISNKTSISKSPWSSSSSSNASDKKERPLSVEASPTSSYSPSSNASIEEERKGGITGGLIVLRNEFAKKQDKIQKSLIHDLNKLNIVFNEARVRSVLKTSLEAQIFEKHGRALSSQIYAMGDAHTQLKINNAIKKHLGNMVKELDTILDNIKGIADAISKFKKEVIQRCEKEIDRVTERVSSFNALQGASTLFNEFQSIANNKDDLKIRLENLVYDMMNVPENSKEGSLAMRYVANYISSSKIATTNDRREFYPSAYISLFKWMNTSTIAWYGQNIESPKGDDVSNMRGVGLLELPINNYNRSPDKLGEAFMSRMIPILSNAQADILRNTANISNDDIEQKVHDLIVEFIETIFMQIDDVAHIKRFVLERARSIMIAIQPPNQNCTEMSLAYRLLDGSVTPMMITRSSAQTYYLTTTWHILYQQIRLDEAREKQHRENLSIEGMVTCPRCKSKATSYYTVQTRSADEPQTAFAHCKNCGHNWKFSS